MQTGTKISGAAHLLLLGWVLFGASLEPEPLPFEARTVSVISADEFAALTTAPATPDVAAQPDALRAPDTPADTPEISPPAETPPEKAQPKPAALPAAETTLTPPAPEPSPQTPNDTAPTLAEPDTAVAALEPPVAPQARPRSVDRVAPKPVAPTPEAKPDPVKRPAVTPDLGAGEQKPPQEATAPEAANDRIVTEADKGKDLAPARSLRPMSRPKRRVAAQPPKPARPKPAADTETAVNAALAEALGGAAPAQAPSGPPLTAGEKDDLRVAVSNCWNIGSLSTAAQATTVVVAVSMTREGRPENGSIRMVSSSGGSQADARQAFGAARRAIIRCGVNGYDLPREKYEQWRDIEMTFNPERMRIK